jgi:hypothetical protein
MTKTSTVHLTINNLSSKTNKELLNPESVFNFENDYRDVLEILDSVSIDVPQEIVENILKSIP